jgi:putative ATP-binding cassette transporter
MTPHLVKFIKNGAQKAIRQMFAVAAVASLSNALMIEFVTESAESSDGRMKYLALFAAVFVVFFWTNRMALSASSHIVEGLLKEKRQRVMSKLLRCQVLRLENLGRGETLRQLSQGINLLSQNIPYILNSAQQSVLLVFCLLYLAYVSMPALVVFLVVTWLGIRLHSVLEANAMGLIGEVARTESRLVDLLVHLVAGFKELRLNTGKRESLLRDFKEVVGKLKEQNCAASVPLINLMLIGNLYVFTCMAVAIFILPQYIELADNSLYKIIAIYLFAFGPISMVVGSMPVILRTESALKELADLEETLEEEVSDADPTDMDQFRDFKTLEYRDIQFTYPGPEGFTAGPLSLEVNRGELIFITGGNGSGKSTALKLLTGLYSSAKGQTRVDDQLIIPQTRPALRSLFSCIFADFHLFERLYGLESVEEEKVTALIEKMQLQDKVEYKLGKFSQTDLSTGQRKRLAMIVALMEDREILVFDEWAAEQDRHFRDYFYRELLPELKGQGKTVIAVTHDDRYWDCADRCVRFDLGRIRDNGAPN